MKETKQPIKLLSIDDVSKLKGGARAFSYPPPEPDIRRKNLLIRFY